MMVRFSLSSWNFLCTCARRSFSLFVRDPLIDSVALMNVCLSRREPPLFPPPSSLSAEPTPAEKTDTGNSCKHIGYDEFDPPSWPGSCAPDKSDWIELNRYICGEQGVFLCDVRCAGFFVVHDERPATIRRSQLALPSSAAVVSGSVHPLFAFVDRCTVLILSWPDTRICPSCRASSVPGTFSVHASALVRRTRVFAGSGALPEVSRKGKRVTVLFAIAR